MMSGVLYCPDESGAVIEAELTQPSAQPALLVLHLLDNGCGGKCAMQ